MDKIILSDMKFYGYHGVFEEERKLGQNFYIDLEFSLDLKKACANDDLNESVDYSKVYMIVKRVVTGCNFKLIEALAHKIIEEIFNEYINIKKVKILLKKPNAPVNGVFGYFGVEIERERND